ncbi:glycosyltransferase family 2 protein [Blastomonas aquatica]|uniref:Succinoglycan biosynthesis protein exoa n=1 Tax=Blastomonas aquatica TaxID=1510276 RepID=A0ABQ1JV50_9SPHN|nr:glycosyltransferase family 2 protein [Blastomonas aquatica]GGB75660.1 succinoglycan biosynthesis protein exoa [Blastomonas aquatica]
MTVLAVIPCLNEAGHIGALLEQLLVGSTLCTIVVADGGSLDGSCEIVERLAQADPRIKLLHNPQRIQSAGINLAVEIHGEGHQWLLRVDAHCLYPPDYAVLLLEAAKKTSASAVVVPMQTVGKSGFQLAVAAAQNSVLGTGGSPHRHIGEGRFVDHGHHALMELQMFRRLGGYCESMPCNEDAELDYRQIRTGGKIWLEPNASIVYFPRATPIALWRQYFRYGVGRARNMRRHMMRPHVRQVAPLVVPVAVMMLPLAIAHPLFALPAAFWLAACLLVGLFVGYRDGGGWRFLAGFAAAIMHLAWGLGFLRAGAATRIPPPQYGLATG